MQDIRSQERRRSRRIRMGQTIRIRPSDPKDEHFEETRTTSNASRDGVYFVSERSDYYVGMRLFVTLPFHIPTDPADKEYLGQVARVVDLEPGKRGIGVQLLSSIGVNPGGDTAPRWK